jgi:hypothetical protein
MADQMIEIPSELRYHRHIRFVMGHVYYDRDAKECVILTNGTCTKGHNLPDDPRPYDGHMSDGTGCVYAPSEALALRVVGVTRTGDPIIGQTYRKVRPEALEPVSDTAANERLAIISRVRRSRFAGRV